MTKPFTSRVLPSISVGLVVVGLALFVVMVGLDIAGFWGGLVQGAGIGAMVVGAYLGGYWGGLRKGADPRVPAWRPSEDVL